MTHELRKRQLKHIRDGCKDHALEIDKGYAELCTIASCAVKTSYDLNAKLIIVFTYSGKSAQVVFLNKPKCPILVVTPNEYAAKGLMLYSGIHHMIVGSLIGRNALQTKIIKEARKRGLLSQKATQNEFIILTSGLAGDIGNTN